VDPYVRILELAEREHALVMAGDFEALAPLQDERFQIVAGLPAVPPLQARPSLVAASRIQVKTTAALEAAKARLAAELTTVDRGRDTARGYALQVPSVSPSFVRSA
jgi:hypothetical protein